MNVWVEKTVTRVITGAYLFLLVAIRSSAFLTFVSRHLMSFSFLSTRHNAVDLSINIYFTSTPVFTPSTKTLAGLNAGTLCAGILIVVFFEMLRPVFSALVLIIKLPKPLK